MKNYLLILFFALTSCATHQGSISNSSIEKNSVYKDVGIGVSNCQYFFGIGGLSKDALVFEAKKQLYRNYPLRQGDSFANFTLDVKTTNYFIYAKAKVTITADIVSDREQLDTLRYTPYYQKIIGSRDSYEPSFFVVGDSILFKKGKKEALIIGLPSNKKTLLSYTSKKGISKTKTKSVTKLYSKKKNYRGLEIGGVYPYKNGSVRESNLSMGRIEAIGLKDVILRTEKNVLIKSK